jgi:hypothetical protein
MSWTLEERSYSGKTFRPRPEIHLDTQLNLLIVATPWGPRSSAQKAIERMTDYLVLTREDSEATSPFERLASLSPQANNLRIATLLANTAIYREDNRQEYRSGVEIFAAMLEGDELVFLQAGNPQLLLARQGTSLLPIGSIIDLSFDFSDGSHILPPLPSQMLGLDSSIHMNINSFRARSGDRLVLLAHSQPPESIYTMNSADANLDLMSRVLAQKQPDLAFWLGVLNLP